MNNSERCKGNSALLGLIVSPSMSIDETTKGIAESLDCIKGAKKIVIIDPYFYKAGSSADQDLVRNLLSAISASLEEIIFITNGTVDYKDAIHRMVRELYPNIKVQDFSTKAFHDRYWIDPERKIGVVMGTSLNGLRKKIALIDKINESDVVELLRLAKKESNITL